MSGEAKSANALPGLTAAEHAAEGATLDLENVRSLHRNRRIVIAAAVRIVNPADPFVVLRRLHVDEDFFAAAFGIAAEIGAAQLDPHIALVLFGRPNADRRGRGGNGSSLRRRRNGCDLRGLRGGSGSNGGRGVAGDRGGRRSGRRRRNGVYDRSRSLRCRRGGRGGCGLRRGLSRRRGGRDVVVIIL